MNAIQTASLMSIDLKVYRLLEVGIAEQKATWAWAPMYSDNDWPTSDLWCCTMNNRSLTTDYSVYPISRWVGWSTFVLLLILYSWPDLWHRSLLKGFEWFNYRTFQQITPTKCWSWTILWTISGTTNDLELSYWPSRTSLVNDVALWSPVISQEYRPLSPQLKS